MDDDVGSDIRQDVRLIKAFLSITDARKRQRILELAERLAEDAASNAAGLAAAEAPTVECRDVPDHIE
ncbi:hypothetical protein [Bradyrhizobium manausense]|uniref:hypothetical protein n=1 Tax=Bradyrhizobium manausense TaxID=989370 RepID=UPI002011E7E5|nr:hypothetical protein [Bradyrhizobium manausense]